MDLLWSLQKRMAGSPGSRAVITGGVFAALFGIGVVDATTGSDLSLGMLYVLAVVALTTAAGEAVGITAALVSAVLWGVADVLTSHGRIGVAIDLWNLVTRFVGNAVVVVLLAALLRAVDAARESERRCRSFLAAAAHQLRTPVAALGASAEALLLEEASPVQDRLLANLAREAARLGHLVSSLLRTARLDQSEPVHLQPVDLQALCREQLERLEQFGAVSTRLTVGATTTTVLLLDPDATAEALWNLLDNARRHATTVDVRIRTAGNNVVVDVTDNGPGLPSGMEAAAFDRFVSLDGQGGTGLGLSIACDLTRQQGGCLTYTEKAFRLTLPFRQIPITGGHSRGCQAELPSTEPEVATRPAR
jgi:signal transduction histidine kinase